MQRVTLCVDDLARIRIIDTLGRHVEAIFAVDALRNTQSDLLRAWRRRVLAKLAHPGKELAQARRLARVSGGSREVLSAWSSDATAPDTAHSGTSGLQRAPLTAAVEEMCQVAVRPHWKRVHAHLASAQDFRRDTMCRDGIEALLNSLGPGIRWNAPVLEIHSAGMTHVKPNGRGLLLSPSLFLQGGAAVLPSLPGRAGSSPVLIFPDRPGGHHCSLLDEGRSSASAASRLPQESLAALLGRTRAAILHALRHGCTNGELAEQLGITPGAVSQHTGTLRAAGLISTRRSDGGRVVHTVTTLGRHLLHAGPDPAEPGRRLGGPFSRDTRPLPPCISALSSRAFGDR
ncbi:MULTISPECIES: ArsR/SmtB family transcription factor [Streptomyces]|uniref:Winged helix-turn-helix transcriptional regulator n=2 Tax=Streptomyces rimosus TaxID=1927 RepID=A0A8A1V751_STRR1|nr:MULTISPECIES: winged helix-turn-helix domain-containing protein [Streptomyces]MYT42096.1 helix-turn-helix domain-containing protein [Streptomyces sp. SID5471]QST86715.1 winged helix-turn-helix transcriptional regulator [Streptomyces rimosus subsp. rimosus ATCC 10970]QXV92036.1 winged helix-turn-helix transcriptional regulator [Streptomyces rimosus]QXV92305.1 winged helix-turn-helix transcriptional regulator [Streptomyces rimosus]